MRIAIVLVVGVTACGPQQPGTAGNPAPPTKQATVEHVPAAHTERRATLVACELPTDFTVECMSDYRNNLAVDAAGRVYVGDYGRVTRFRRVAGGACKLERDPTFASTLSPTPCQGGATQAEWHVAARGDGAVFAFDQTCGIHRIDEARVTAICSELYGITELAPLSGDRAIARSRKGAVTLDLANKCDATPVDLQPTTNGGPFSIAGVGKIVFSADGNGHVRHHTGKAQHVIAGTTDVFRMTTCGDRVCTLDANHGRIARYDERAQLTETYTFSRPVEVLSELAGGLDGKLYTAHAAKKRRDNRCELTLFAVQPR